MLEAPSISEESTIAEVLQAYRDKGAEATFASRAEGMLHCDGCGADEPADQAPLRAMHRFEGNSDPEDEAALAIIECPACGTWGTMTFAYGPGASAEDAEVLARLIDARDQSGIEPGQ